MQESLQGSLQDNLAGGVQHGDLIVRENGALRRITLNRPKALNALTLDAAETAAIVIRITSPASSLRYISISDMILRRRERSDAPIHQEHHYTTTISWV